jgi:tRNA threonylcarbamoyladenosine modification (KEOPS) complex  Pcc1 subunit
VTEGDGWRATIRVHRPTAAEADRVIQALEPEVAREVPRARAELARPDTTSVEVRITAADTSACRAALNTYLAWVGLVLSTERAANSPNSSVSVKK